MKRPALMAKIKVGLTHCDRQILYWINTHRNLLAALITLTISMWAIVFHLFWVIPAMVLVGAVSYFLGVAVSFGCMLMLIGFSVATAGSIAIGMTRCIGELAGFLSVAWLGYQHKTETILERTHQDSHSDQLVPWHVVNDVRTSLAAIRFLLFPVANERQASELNQVTEELSRLEHLFTQIEKEGYSKKKP